MKILGIVLIIWGFADFGLSWLEIDVYYTLGIQLSDEIWPYTHYISIALGFIIYSLGKRLQK